MNFNKEIAELVSNQVGGIVIVDVEEQTIAYVDSFLKNKYGKSIIGERVDDYAWLNDCPAIIGEESVAWEALDIEYKRYYRIQSISRLKDGKMYYIHQLIDITEYIELNREITKYMAVFKKLSKFQMAVVECLPNTFYELLHVLTDCFKTDKAYYFNRLDDKIEIIQYDAKVNIYNSARIEYNDLYSQILTVERGNILKLNEIDSKLADVFCSNGGDISEEYYSLCQGVVSEREYSIFMRKKAGADMDSMSERTLTSVIHLFIENGIIRESLKYNSEHDKLTGLYNKAKYMELMEKEYPFEDSIAVFNLDVNNLKVMNDTYGHAMGDKLLYKAADSIRKVVNDKIHGFRIGGDEFIIIATNVTEEETKNILKRWEEELKRLNTVDTTINCVIAVGYVYSKAPYDLPNMLLEADRLMYIDKKEKKKPGEEIR